MQLPLQASKLVYVIPAFDEADVLARVIEERCREAPPGLVLVVGDASSDEPGAVAARAGATVIRHPIDRGRGAALQTGFDRMAHASELLDLISSA